MRKKIFAFVLLMLLALPLALAGCNDKGGYVAGSGKLVDLSAMPDGTAEEYQYLYDQVIVGDKSTTGLDYVAHPDSVLLDNGDIITAFSLGHGLGGTAMRISHDKGLSWEVMDLPDSFANNQETPTIYKLNFTDGSQKLVLISGRPSWNKTTDQDATLGEGWDASVSTSLDPDGGCDGLVWSEMENFYGPNADRAKYVKEAGAEKFDAVVAMSALVQLKENGEFVDKWMGLYHDDRTFTVYKTILTFNEGGQMEWSEPVRMLGQNGEWREYEEAKSLFGLIVSGNGFCETEIIRSPDGNELAALFRVNAKSNYSYVTFSTDEGKTWSEPQTMSQELTGERHKAEYDPVTGKLVITMRNITYTEVPDGKPSSWVSRGWVAWIGDYEDLKRGADGKGDMLVKLANTYNSGVSEITEFCNADTGYAGLVVYPDGTFVTTGYGYFSPADDPDHGGQSYIISKQFKVQDLASLAGVTLR